MNFYDYLKEYKGVLLELLKVRVTDHDVTYQSSFVWYTTNRDEYNQIYNHFCTYDREYIPHFIVSTDTSYYNIYEDDDFTDREVISSLGLQDDFNSLMNIYRSNTTDHDSTSNLQTILTHNITHEQSIIQYTPNQQQIVDFNTETTISYDASYPEFYKEKMIDESLSHAEVESKFLKENWLTEELTNQLIEHSPCLPKNTDYSSDFSPNSLFETKCNNLFPIGRKFCNYLQLDQYVTLFLKSWKIMKN